QTLVVSCVSMGNPHAITFAGLDVLDGYPLEVIGPKVEHHAAFPQRTNFEICEGLAPDRMRVRVWERGAGITRACGTAAWAAATPAGLPGRGRTQGWPRRPREAGRPGERWPSLGRRFGPC